MATKNTSPSEYSVTIALPAEAFVHRPWRPGRIAAELRTLWLIEQVRDRRLGYGKAAELAGVPKAEFVRLMGERQVSAVDYDPDELRRELETAASLQAG